MPFIETGYEQKEKGGLKGNMNSGPLVWSALYLVIIPLLQYTLRSHNNDGSSEAEGTALISR